ncbi:WGR domain-containing protein, partial [Actinokineospora pegani]|uniref:WGR domain-containing protein n=1 Tax=Actinokineospora pegani TaxID=2654637 RepID=UPI0012EA2557
MTRRLEYVGGGSEKFWEGALTGTTVTARWGRLGSAGQTNDKVFATVEAAQAHLDKLVAEKVRKGYSEAGAPAPTKSKEDKPAPEPGAAGAAEEPGTAGEPGAITWPDEERYDPPAALLRLAVPRRGRVRSPRRVTPGMVEAAEHLLEGRKIELRGVLSGPKTDPDLREAGLGQLLGTPSPLGAAVVFELAAHERSWSEDAFACLADQWIGRWGPAFAAEALLLVTSLDVQVDRKGGDTARWITRGQQRFRWTWNGEAPAHRIRASLASAEDDEYARAVEALAGLRDTQRRRAIVAYLLPTEREWVDETKGTVGGRDGLELRCRLGAVETMADAEPVLRAADLHAVTHSNRTLPTLVDQLGPALAATVDEWVDSASGSAAKTLLGHLASFPTDEAMTALVRRAAERGTAPFLQEALRRFPRRGARVLAEALGARADVGVLEPLLSAHLLAWPGVADGLEVSDRGRAALDRLLAATRERLPAADPADLPPVLADPPWLREKAKTQAVVVAGLEPLGADAITWAAGEQDEWLASADDAERPHELAGGEEIVWNDLFDEFVHTSYWLSMPLIVLGPEDRSRDLARRLRPNHVWEMGEWFRAAVGRFGLDTLDLLLHIAADQPAIAAPYLAPFTGPRVARAMAGWLVRLKTTRATAVAWFARHGAAAVRPLVPDALAKPGKARTAAEAALRLVAQRAGDEPVLAVAREYGPEAEAGVRALLAGDPLEALPAKLPEVGEWANPALLPQLALADRRCGLSLDHAKHVITVLSLCRPGEPYAGLAQVKAATDPGSLARFTWRLFSLWAGGGFVAKDNWVLTVLGEVGDDEVVRALSPLIRAWPGEGGHARAVIGLDVLADIGTDVALMHLNGIANKVKFKGLKERAEEKMRAVAERIGLSSEQLADRLVPDLGLDTDGSMVLDYGPRKFTVGFD